MTMNAFHIRSYQIPIKSTSNHTKLKCSSRSSFRLRIGKTAPVSAKKKIITPPMMCEAENNLSPRERLTVRLFCRRERRAISSGTSKSKPVQYCTRVAAASSPPYSHIYTLPPPPRAKWKNAEQRILISLSSIYHGNYWTKSRQCVRPESTCWKGLCV